MLIVKCLCCSIIPSTALLLIFTSFARTLTRPQVIAYAEQLDFTSDLLSRYIACAKTLRRFRTNIIEGE